MPTQVTAGYHEIMGRAGALVGEAATTTSATTGLPVGTHWVSLTARNFSTAVAVGFKVCPWLVILKTQDDNATFTDYSEAAQDDDQDTLVDLSSQDTAANGDYVYVGSHIPFRGVDIDVNATNSSVSSDLTVEYWSSTGLWTDLSASDGTNGTESLDQDGKVTWTVPANTLWQPNRLNGILATNVTIPSGNAKLYWTRWTWGVATDSSTTQFSWHGLPEIHPESRDADGSDTLDYSGLIENQSFEMACRRGPGGFGAVEYITDAGTANLIINVGQKGRDV